MGHSGIAVVGGLSRLVQGFSAALRIGGISSSIKVLVTLLELNFGVLDGLGQILDWFCDSRLQSGLEEEQEGNEDKDVKEQ